MGAGRESKGRFGRLPAFKVRSGEAALVSFCGHEFTEEAYNPPFLAVSWTRDVTRVQTRVILRAF